MTTRTRIQRPRQQTAEQAAAEKKTRKRFQREKPGLAELLASGRLLRAVVAGGVLGLAQGGLAAQATA